MPLRYSAQGDTWAHACGAFLGGTDLEKTPCCWWCGKDIVRAVPVTDAMLAAKALGGQEAVRVILRTIPDIAAEVPADIGPVTIMINGVPVVTDASLAIERVWIVRA